MLVDTLQCHANNGSAGTQSQVQCKLVAPRFRKVVASSRHWDEIDGIENMGMPLQHRECDRTTRRSLLSM